MYIHTTKKMAAKNTVDFFDFWVFNEIDNFASIPSERTSERTAKKSILKQVCRQLPEHCAQLLFLS